jgi:N-acyl-D-amino-acid deacylase
MPAALISLGRRVPVGARLGAGVLLVSMLCAPAAAASIPVTGPGTPSGMQAWDTAAEQIMATNGMPGGELAVAYQGRVVLEHGYGYADTKTSTPVQPSSLFRLASVSKTITAVAVAKLIAEHKLSAATRPFVTILNKLRAPHDKKPVDSRLKRITVQELLVHEGGWDIAKLGYDPVFNAGPEEKALKLHSAPTCEQAIEYMLGVRLSFAPGTQKAYSNFGYCVLGDVIAHVMKTSFPKAIRTLVFDPLDMRRSTFSLDPPSKLLPGEVHYYGQGSEAAGPQSPAKLSLTASQGAAGLVSSAPDLERFMIAMTATRPGSSPFVSSSLTPRPVELPPLATPGRVWQFNGSLPGTNTTMAAVGPVTYVFLTNSRPGTHSPKWTALNQLAQSQASWPGGDLLSPPAR